MTEARRVELPVPPEVQRIARRLRGAGFDTWAVGGAVRDALIGLQPGDWDLTTAARPDQMRALFRRTVPIGIEHGTVGVLGKDGRLYEVTTFRRDVETFGRRARVLFSDTLEEDLHRRDFTINAVAWDPVSGELRDPHGGAEDLQKGILRTVGDADARFAEDWLRILRALRFAGRFSLRIHPDTWAALRRSAGQLGGLSAERIREELFKVLGGAQTPSASLRLYAESGVLAFLYPELHATVGLEDPRGGDVWGHLLAATDAAPPSRLILRLAALFHDVGKPAVPRDVDTFPGHAEAGAALARNVMRRLKASNADADLVVHLVAQHSAIPRVGASDADIRRWLRTVGLEHYRKVLALRAADCRARGSGGDALVRATRRIRRVVAERPALAIADLAIGGSELRAVGVAPGPRYGEVLRELLERVIDEPALNTPERLIALARDLEE